MSFQLNTTGNDSNALFDYFLIAYGGKDIVTEDGKLHIHDPAIKEAVIKTVTYPTTAYKEGFVPPGGDQLERRRRLQRLSCEADRHGSRRRDLNRGRKTGRRALARRGLVSWYWAELRLVSSSLTPITIRIAEH
ncbi:MAG TPA: hypothetical protein VGF39_07915 [Stellaceae bacterium]